MSNRGTVSAEHLFRLEEKLAHQEHTIGELDGVIYRQQRQLDELTARYRQLEALVERMVRRSEDGGGGEPQQERPPHY
ncbi:SlyX family protein [Alkalilimnicola ehrlichii MLHE-1]|uniref:SlyX protein, putative n=1 Tax=Alkalilimnicola ehrlichii (strain ATCC BAA-1101 / DSM 17681 / MLHE-1) TaxID=187272 RepID=Q0ABZ4_ALKEH|nr:SlyX family protein [Alkalilimnicola ehrlichii]ABI55643.1 SlyX protein, putative [Alkalilimnicola ehrlichii MLHE-1]